MRPRTKTRLRLHLARAARYLLLPAALLLATRLLWGLEAAHRLHKTLADLHAAGIPCRRTDFLDPPLPNDQNAIPPLFQALDATTLSSTEQDLLEASQIARPFSEIAFTDAQLPEVDRLLASLSPAFDDLDIAVARPATSWPPLFFSDQYDIIEPTHLYRARTLADALYDDALRAHDHKDTAAVLHRLSQILALARLLDSRPTFGAHVGQACPIRALAAAGVERFALDLPYTPATLATARRFAADLADTAAFDRALIRSCQAHLVLMADDLHANFPAYDSWLLRPLATDELARTMRAQMAVVRVAQTPSFVDIQRLLHYSQLTGDGLDTLTLSFSQNWPLNPRCFQLHDRALVDSRAAALLLAAEGFRHQRGHYPDSLADLSDLFPTPPADPFSPDNRLLRYRLDLPAPATPEALGGPTVWSVNENAIDDNAALPATRPVHLQRFAQSDLVYGAAWKHTQAAWRAQASALTASSTTPPAPPPPPSTSPRPGDPPQPPPPPVDTPLP